MAAKVMYAAVDYFDLSRTAHPALFGNDVPVWHVLKHIGDWITANASGKIEGEICPGAHVGNNVTIGKGTVVEPGATIIGPAWIGENCEIRAGAYIRQNVITGNRCTLGNSCEFKNCILFDDVEVPHFSYVGDSVLGYKSHLGAGVILSNVKLDRKEVSIRNGANTVSTGLYKFSAIIGDHTEIGCNSIISPGSLIGKNCVLYPGTHWGGLLADSHIVKVRQTQIVVERH